MPVTATSEITGEYTFVAPERQNELTRRIQEKLAEASINSQQALSSLPVEIGWAAENGQDRLRAMGPIQ